MAQPSQWTALGRVLLTRMLQWQERQDVGVVDALLCWLKTLKCRRQRKWRERQTPT